MSEFSFFILIIFFPFLPLFFDVYLFLTICRQMKETTMADPEKFQETSEEVRHLENPKSFQFWRLSLIKYFAGEMQFLGMFLVTNLLVV